MRFLVFEHLPVEHFGALRDLWNAAGIQRDEVELDEGVQIPSHVAAYGALIAMGGPMDGWQEDAYPWLKVEKAAIRDWVVRWRKPFLGICLGHQLPAEALCGAVAPTSQPEVGVVGVSRSSTAANDPIMSCLAAEYDCLQWHGAEAIRLPEGAEIIATNARCPIQAFRWGDQAYGFQYHIEPTETTVSDWAAVPTYRWSLASVLGANACEQLENAVSISCRNLKPPPDASTISLLGSQANPLGGSIPTVKFHNANLRPRIEPIQ